MKTVVRYFINEEITCRYEYTYDNEPIIPHKNDIIHDPCDISTSYSVMFVCYNFEAPSTIEGYVLVDVHCFTDTPIMTDYNEFCDAVYDGDKIYEEICDADTDR